MDLRNQIQPLQVSTNPARTARRPIVWGIAGCLLGIIIGSAVLLLGAFLFMGDRDIILVPSSTGNDAITVQVSSTYLSQVVRKNIQSAGLPGDIKNVQVSLSKDNKIAITGDDQVSALGAAISKHFKVTLQPFVQNCQFHVQLLHADLDGIPTTGFMTLLTDQIDQQIQAMQSTMPSGFTYCAQGVHTDHQKLVIIYSATPT